jgi:hypothetical protein
MSNYICHDFKTPRADTSKRLPNTFKVIPVLFYAALAGGAFFAIKDTLSYQSSVAKEKQFKATKADKDAAIKVAND